MSQPVITIKNLTKLYKNGLKALDNVSLEIKQGEIFALLGPNGAGKTTLINTIAGLAQKTEGEVLVMGKDIEKDYRFTRSKIGLVPQEITVEIAVKIIDSVWAQAGYFGLRDGKKRAQEILEQLELGDKANQYAMTLSGGMKRRVMIAKAMVHDPDILFLDEPTAGVDLELREKLWERVAKLRDQGKTIILTTHYLEEAEALADRICVINHGRVVLLDEKENLLNNQDGKNLNSIYAQIMAEEKAKQA